MLRLDCNYRQPLRQRICSEAQFQPGITKVKWRFGIRELGTVRS